MTKFYFISMLALGAIFEMQTTQEEAVGLAKQALASELGSAVDSIEVGEVVETEWSDSSLGCPQKGMMYAQVMTPGYRVTLVADGEHRVHVGGGRAVVCRNHTRGPDGSRRPQNATKARLLEAARKDLARRLKVPMAEIEVRFVRPHVWPDSSLGCPVPGKDYRPGRVEGYLIVLRHEGKSFNYHADQKRTVFCELDQKGQDQKGTGTFSNTREL
jgi:hypothetical protein